MGCKGVGLIDFGVGTWHERRKGQKRKTAKREEEVGGRERVIKNGSRSVERRRERWNWGGGIGKRKGKGRAVVGEGYTLRTAVFILQLHIPNLVMWLRER